MKSLIELILRDTRRTSQVEKKLLKLNVFQIIINVEKNIFLAPIKFLSREANHQN